MRGLNFICRYKIEVTICFLITFFIRITWSDKPGTRVFINKLLKCLNLFHLFFLIVSWNSGLHMAEVSLGGRRTPLGFYRHSNWSRNFIPKET